MIAIPFSFKKSCSTIGGVLAVSGAHKVGSINLNFIDPYRSTPIRILQQHGILYISKTKYSRGIRYSVCPEVMLDANVPAVVRRISWNSIRC